MPKCQKKSKISRRHVHLLRDVLFVISNNEDVCKRTIWQFFVHYLATEKPLTIGFLQDALVLLYKNRDYLSSDYFKVHVPLELELGRLVAREKLTPIECSICLEHWVTHRHCITCRGIDKLVCKSCIVNMFELSGMTAYYDCPHCRTTLFEPKWINNHVGALRKIRRLLSQPKEPEECFIPRASV